MLTRSRLAWKSLAFHWRATLGGILAAATACAVITGALMVGDSVRHSLWQRVETRLGAVNTAVVSQTPFRALLAADLARDAELKSTVDAVVPVLALKGTVVHADSSRRATRVNIFGVRPEFWRLWPRRELAEAFAEVGRKRQTWVNQHLATAIGAAAEDSVLLHLQREEGIPAEHALGRRTETIRNLRLTVRRIVPDDAAGLFDLQSGQQAAQNVFVPLELLQRSLDLPDDANVLLISTPKSESGALEANTKAVLEGALRREWQLADAGLALEEDAKRGYLMLESKAFLLPSSVTEVALRGAKEIQCESLQISTYLSNSIRKGDAEVPYSTITAIGEWEGESGTEPVFPGAAEALRSAATAVLNDWTTRELTAAVGDSIDVAYYTLDAEHRLSETTARLRVGASIPLAGAAADPRWTPRYPGVTDRDSLRDWDPPFPVDLDRIRDQDDDYWAKYRTTPKLFVSLAEGRRLWPSRFGYLTALRFRPGPGSTVSTAELFAALTERLRAELDPTEVGFSIVAVKKLGIEAAEGSTDFAGLFVGFSFFIILAALVLLSLVMRLSAETRSREFGVLVAAGFAPPTVRRLLWREAALIAALGCAAGTPLGIAYAAGLMNVLADWQAAVGASFLALAAPSLTTLVVGPTLTLLLASLTLMLTSWKLTRQPPARLLAGLASADPALAGTRSRRSAWIAAVTLLLAVVTLVIGLATESLPAVLFFIAGALLLVGGLALTRTLSKPRAIRPGGGLSRGGKLGLWALGWRNSSRAPGRSLLTVTVLAAATFIIVIVAAMRRDATLTEPNVNSGNGGFRLVARSAVPILLDPTNSADQDELNVREQTATAINASQLFAFRVEPGDDTSCRNLYRPQKPHLLGAPEAFIDRGGFAWSASLAETEAERENPWLLLKKTLPDGAIPAVGDGEAVQWILHSGLGKDLVMTDEFGEEIKIRFVALLSHSIFQGEVIVADHNLAAHFPSRAGRQYFLIDVDEPLAATLSAGLERDVGEYGIDVQTTGELLATFQSVVNTYLSTFQLLGGLGLLLGTLGLGTVLYRNVNERRAELALLRAVGYSRGALAGIILSETGGLLAAGLLVGAAAALLAALPNLLATGSEFAWGAVSRDLAVVFAAGWISCVAALSSALKAPLIPSLRRE